MHIDDFIWLPDIIEKLIVKHHVTPDEAEEIFFNRPRYRFMNQDIQRVKMSIQPLDKLMRVGI